MEMKYQFTGLTEFSSPTGWVCGALSIVELLEWLARMETSVVQHADQLIRRWPSVRWWGGSLRCPHPQGPRLVGRGRLGGRAEARCGGRPQRRRVAGHGRC